MAGQSFAHRLRFGTWDEYEDERKPPKRGGHGPAIIST
ncbi:hypothetical protein THTE_0921 [Thermogutta terrifontis]|uniref:Uncharacterized protein n=1 Tax=Thermogutta terrifontis TaxID=1331910 RepID=A0A286RC30_9BACT|nr:hypothetical protein THTE_0921 [Thermogutta terrifontis]